MKYILSILFLGFMIQISAQNASVTMGCAPLNVQFNTNPLSTYYWDFMDGASSDQKDPSHLFVNPGTYNVILYEGVGGQKILEILITVYADPEIKFTANSTSGCSPFQVQFTDESIVDPNITVTGYFWDFGDGSSSNLQNPSHTYFNEGQYTVTLRVETAEAECTVTEIFTDFITVSGKVDAKFAIDKLVECTTPATFTITNTGTNDPDFTYLWDFGNGNTTNTFDPGMVTYNNNGSYTVSLTVDNGKGCKVTISRILKVGPPKLVLDIPDTICINVPHVFDNNTLANQYSWTFADGNPDASNQRRPAVTFNSPGLKIVTFSAIESPTCKSDTFFTVFVENPSADFTIDPLINCGTPAIYNLQHPNPNFKNYLWLVNDVGFAGGHILNYEYYEQFRDSFYINRQDTFEVTLKIETNNGCFAEATKMFFHQEPNAHIVPNVSRGCAPLQVTFEEVSTSTQPITEWNWDFGDGTTSSVNSSLDMTHTYDAPGEYYVKMNITNSAGCQDTSTGFYIYVGEPLSGDISIDKTDICLYDTVFFSTSNIDPRIDSYHFNTDDRRIDHCYESNSTSHTFITEPGTFPVSLTIEYNGCLNTIQHSEDITVNGTKSRFAYMTNCADPYTIMLRDSSINAMTSIWVIGTDTISSDTLMGTEMTYTFDTTGDYTIYLFTFDDSGCRPDTSSETVYIRDIQANFEIPEIICARTSYTLDASSSIDVDDSCSKGYEWFGIAIRPRLIDTAFVDAAYPPGVHEIYLVTEDVNGCKDTTMRTVTAIDFQADFEFDKDKICYPSELIFTNLSTSDTTITSYNWSFGATTENPTQLFTDGPSDILYVQLNFEDALGCVDTITKFIDVYHPSSDITFAPGNVVCVGNDIKFMATDFTEEGSFLNFFWNFGNNEQSNEQNPVFTVNNPGITTVNLNIVEDSTGCNNSYSLNVQGIVPPVADFDTDPGIDNEICYPAIVSFMNTSTEDGPVTYKWDFGNGTSVNLENPSSSFDKGSFDVQLITSSIYGCSDTISKTVKLVGPEGKFVTDKIQVCKGEPILFTMVDTVDVTEWIWDFGDGTVENDVNPVSHKFLFHPPNGTTNVNLIIKSSENGCEALITQPVDIFRVIADFNPLEDSIYCLGQASFINSSIGANSYQWNFGNGITQNSTDASFTYDSPGQYFVTLAIADDISGCKDTLTKEISIQPTPVINIETDTVCAPDPGVITILNYNPNYLYTASPASDVLQIVGNQITVSGEATGTYSVVVTDLHGCKGTENAVVIVIDEPEPFEDFDTVVLEGNTVTLPFVIDDPDLYNFSWNISNGLDCTDCNFPVVTPPSDSTTYIATISDRFGCSVRQWTFVVNVLDKVIIPTIFSPNNDGTNDYFDVIIRPFLREYVDVVKLKVYNRWGNLVYDNTLPDQGWDGRYDNGEEAPAEVYTYVMQIIYINGEGQSFKGTVTLIK